MKKYLFKIYKDENLIEEIEIEREFLNKLDAIIYGTSLMKVKSAEVQIYYYSEQFKEYIPYGVCKE